MATRRMDVGGWTPGSRTRIMTSHTSSREPRDVRVGVLKPTGDRRPSPLNIELTQPKAPLLTAAVSPLPDIPLIDYEPEVPSDPEIVDLAAPETWARCEASLSLQRCGSAKHGSPSVKSRQSEIFFGILDYYMRDTSPMQSPELPMAATPVLDPAIEQFDFGLRRTPPLSRDTRSDADADFDLVPLSPRPIDETAAQTRSQHKKTYSLFPVVKDASPSTHRVVQIINDPVPATLSNRILTSPPQFNPSQRRSVLLTGNKTTTTARQHSHTLTNHSPPNPHQPTLASRIASIQTPHQPPHASYRPRKVSLSSSIRSRKESFNSSYNSSRRILLRIISTTSTKASSHSSASASTSNASPPYVPSSRWSDDTITSPTAVRTTTTPGLRTSLGSLLDGGGAVGRDDYPACFFEDDEEDAPLRRKFAWKRNLSLTHGEGRRKATKSRFEGRRGGGNGLPGWLRVMFCGCAG